LLLLGRLTLLLDQRGRRVTVRRITPLIQQQGQPAQQQQ
jgi:hypothetical protein